jgi:uncharacterized membrane protein HdeD (DUF308 family)
MKKFHNWRWWTVALRGVAALLLGILAVFAPNIAFMGLVVLFGVYAIVDGTLAFGLASEVGGPLRFSMIARGLISIIAGVLALALPGITGFALLMVIATWAIVSGILEIVMAIRIRKEIQGEWLLALEGVLSILFGVLLYIAPLAGAIVLGLWVGAYALVLGGMLLGSAFRLRRFMRQQPQQPEMAAA